MNKSGITKEKLIDWGGNEVFNQAFSLCLSGAVKGCSFDFASQTATGKIEQPDGWDMPVAFETRPDGLIKSRCKCRTNQLYGQICPHVLAVGIAIWINEMEEVPPPQKKTTDDDTAATQAEEQKFIEIPMKPRFFALVSGSRAALSIELDAYYGEIDFPACSIQAERTVYLTDPDDDLVRRTRSLDTEKAAMAMLERDWGFEKGYREGDLKLYLSDQQKVLNFLGAGLSALRRRGWRVDLSERLMATAESMTYIVPVVTIKDAPGGAFDVKYTFDAMGREINPAEIQAALNRGDGYILNGGETFLLDNSAIEAMHDVFRDTATSQNGAPSGWFRVNGVYAPYVKSSLDRLDSIDLDDSAARRWRENAERRNDRREDARFEPVALGPLENVLRPYQKQGVYWMRFLEEAGHSGLLADEMGLGKTLQTLTWLTLPRAAGNPALIVAPTSLVRNWEAEAKKFTPSMKTLVISGPDREREWKRIDESDLVITSYQLLQRDFDGAYAGREFSAVVIDEAQHIKNRHTKNAQTVKSISARRRLALTGTPIENSVADAWSIFDFLMPGYLGEYESFRMSFEEPIAEGGAAGEEALQRLKRKIHPFIMRRIKKTVAKDLPDKIIKVSYCPMSEDGQREYLKSLAETRLQAGEAMRRKGFAKSKFEILAMLMKLRMIASQAKLEPFMEQLISAVEGGHRILVFSQFVKTLSMIGDELKRSGIPFCYLDGSTKNRLEECEKFNRTRTIPVFLISLMAGGTGLNLTGADMVMHYDPWWNPAVENQATDRAHRIGQKKTVYVIKMIAVGSIEEKVLALQRKKEAIIKSAIETTDAAVMESLTAAELNELLS